MTGAVRVYISGPVSVGDRAANTQRRTDAADWFTDRGVAALCPMYSHHPQARPCEPGTERDDRASDLAWVEAADAVLLLPGRSADAVRECAHAAACGVPVFTSREQALGYLNGLKALRVFVAQFGAGQVTGGQRASVRTRRAHVPARCDARDQASGAGPARAKRRAPTRSL